MAVTKLSVVWEKRYLCPKCGKKLTYVPGGAVAIVNGKVDMERTQPHYACEGCGVYYKELLGSGYFEEYPLRGTVQPNAAVPKGTQAATVAPPAPQPAQKPRPVRRTGDLEPVQLRREADGKCTCPRCGGRMDFVEGQPVRIVDGKPDMENVKDHFHCPDCDSVFRRIATTDYFQWSEK